MATFNGFADEIMVINRNLKPRERAQLVAESFGYPIDCAGELIFPHLFLFTPDGKTWLDDLIRRLSEAAARDRW